MESLTFSVGVLGNLISVLMFLAPMETFRRVAKNKSTEDLNSYPYICALLTSSLWTYYGIIKPGGYLISTVNGFGVLVEIVYVSLFLIYAPPKLKKKIAIVVGLMDVGYMVTAIAVAHLLTGADPVEVIGSQSTGIHFAMYSFSFMDMIYKLRRTKEVEYMHFLLAFLLMLNGGVWYFYAALTQDRFLRVPHRLGLVLGMAELVVCAIYRGRKPLSHLPTDLEEASPSQYLLPTGNRSKVSFTNHTEELVKA